MKQLYRSQEDGVIAGVCAGIAEYLNADVTPVRILFVLMGLSFGQGVIIYLICWALMPENPLDKRENGADQN